VHDLEEFKAEVSEILRGELVSRYHYQSGRIEAMLEDDPEVKKALDILADTSEYNRILSDTSTKE
jgi:carboxyl-terminal processing protease